MDLPADATDPDATVLAEDLRRAVGTFVRAIRTAADGRSAQEETLGLLDRHGPMNGAALAQARNVKHQTMRLVVAQLEAAGLVRRTPDPTDQRSQLVSISEAGWAELGRRRAGRAARIAAMIRETTSDQERAVLRASILLLDRISAAAEA